MIYRPRRPCLPSLQQLRVPTKPTRIYHLQFQSPLMPLGILSWLLDSTTSQTRCLELTLSNVLNAPKSSKRTRFSGTFLIMYLQILYSQAGFRRHAKTHNPKLKCRYCEHYFAEQRDLRRHQQARHLVTQQNSKSYFCSVENCEFSLGGTGKGFHGRRDNAQRHIRRQHKGKNVSIVERQILNECQESDRRGWLPPTR